MVIMNLYLTALLISESKTGLSSFEHWSWHAITREVLNIGTYLIRISLTIIKKVALSTNSFRCVNNDFS